MDEVRIVTDNHKDFLRFMKSKFPLYHLSNVFFRDLHYGVMNYLMGYRRKVNYSDGEKITRGVVAELEKLGILRPVDKQTWVLHYPEFQLPRVKKAS